MGKTYDEISDDLAAWIRRQRMFFVATAPTAVNGHINCSPKGLDTFRILGPQCVGYLDLTGSGVETIAHVRENRRIVFVFCAFSGPPKIVRIHGSASVIFPTSPQWDQLQSLFPMIPGVRAIIRADITRISDSCGLGVPEYEFKHDRPSLPQWAKSKGLHGISEYQRQKNCLSLDGLPAIDP